MNRQRVFWGGILLVICLAAIPLRIAFADAKSDKDAARREKEEVANRKRAEREAERAKVQEQRQRAEQERQARRAHAERQQRGGRESGNDAIRTQRDTAVAYDRQRREKDAASRPPTTAPADSDERAATAEGDDLAQVERQITEERERHETAVARFRRAMDSARRRGNASAARDAEIALSREEDAHRRSMGPLTQRRDELMKQSAPPKESEPAPAGGKQKPPTRR